MKTLLDRQMARLRERLLLARAVPGDRLLLADATLQAALDGTRVLTPKERQALSASPLTLRRFRRLSLARYAHAGAGAGAGTGADTEFDAVAAAANDDAWNASVGMLRAAASAAPLTALFTDDHCWALHFLPQDQGWQVILNLSAQAPYAARLLRERSMVRVIDGAGAILLQGQLDADGEVETRWPFVAAPTVHLQQYGAAFVVEPVID